MKQFLIATLASVTASLIVAEINRYRQRQEQGQGQGK